MDCRSAERDVYKRQPVRQRRIGIQDRFGEVGDVSYLLKTMKMTAEDIAAVSYTHLDVYKRQEYSRS